MERQDETGVWVPSTKGSSATSAEQVQWRNILKVVKDLAAFCFGDGAQQGQITLGSAYTSVVTALTAKDGLQVQLEPLPAEQPRNEQVLRRLLAYRVAGALLYADDGELQDNTVQPFIDFKRDPVDVIEAKLIERTKRELSQPAVERGAVGDEVTRERAAQVSAVMPLIGPMLDAFDGLPGDFKSDLAEHAPDLCRYLKAINTGMTTLAAPVGEAVRNGWITDPDSIPQPVIDECRNAIRREFGNNGTDGYYKRILARVFAAVRAAALPQPAVERGVVAERAVMFKAYSECYAQGAYLTPDQIADRLLAAAQTAPQATGEHKPLKRDEVLALMLDNHLLSELGKRAAKW